MEAMEGMTVARRIRQERAWTLTGAARGAREGRIATVRFLQTPAAQAWEMGKLLTAYQMREVAKVLDVERRQREFIGQAAGSDPSVVLWPWAAPPLGRRRDLTPDSGDVVTAVQHRDPAQPPGHSLLPQGPPLPSHSPLRELTLGDERSGRFAAD